MKFTCFAIALLLFSCSSKSQENSSKINLPSGFSISVYAEVESARSMTISPKGTLFIGSRSSGNVSALQDLDGDGVAERKFTIASNLNTPNGVAFKDGDLYVAEISRILRFPNIEAKLDNPPNYEVVYDDYPKDRHHGWKYIAFGPDGKLYVPVGAPCNICKSDEIYATITRIDPEGKNMEIVAHGIRNTVGFTWHPETKELWFTDNGRDMMGDEYPPCELNKITRNGQHFGYPFCHGGEIADPKFGSERHCNDFVKPEWKFKAHVAPLGLKFYTGNMFPEEYKGDLFVAQHGSWNRSKKIGYRIMRMHLENGKVKSAHVFADGWMNNQTQEVFGRPVDILQMVDGSILVSDDYAGKIYRISYDK